MKTNYLILSAIAVSLFFFGCSPSSENSESTPSAEEVLSEPTYNFVKQHALTWEEAIKQIDELADAMPEEMYSYRPHDSLMTFAEQLVHIGGSSKVMAGMFLKDQQPDGPPPQMNLSDMSREEIKDMVRTNLQETGDIIASMSDEQLQEEVKSFSGNDMTRQQAIMLIHDHLTNHKAKVNLYVRVSGNTPPDYRYY